MIKVLTVFGTRPEAIKMAPIVLALGKLPASFINKVCVTAQHRQLLDQVFDIFDIRPDYDLDIMTVGQDLFDVTCSVLQGLKKVINQEKPEVLLVHGDTTTSMAAALAGYYCQVPIVGHVEAGLRTRKKFSPFPEEINRTITARLADIHFSPTAESRKNLLGEGIPPESIHVTGNTIIDALETLRRTITDERQTTLRSALIDRFPSLARPLNSASRKIILVTAHRRESFGAGFEEICRALLEIADRHPEADIIYPVHPNPQVQRPVQKILAEKRRTNIHLVEPLDYLSFLFLMFEAAVIVTDSGGIQEEAPSLGKPVILLRETTERPEAVAAGFVKLVGTNRRMIVSQACRLLEDRQAYQAMVCRENPYGDGMAAERIVALLLRRGKSLSQQSASGTKC
jgi:UDP-N-acetylglucosamine 2-epimerase (non-hydrolysing)